MFLEFLLSQNVINELGYNRVLAELDTKFGGNLNKAILSLGVDEDTLTQNKAVFYKKPYQKVDPESISYDVIKYIPEDAARHYHFVPIGFAEGILSVGFTEPENLEAENAIEFIAAKLGIPFKVFLISYSDFIAVLENYKALSQEVDRAVGQFSEEMEIATKSSEDKKILKTDEKGETKIVEDAPIIKIVDVIIEHAVEGRASDIHIENTGEKVRVRYRVDGILHQTLELPLNTFNGVMARIKIMSNLKIDEKRKPQDGSFVRIVNGRPIEFRVSTLPSYNGEKAVMRILDSERGIKSLNDLDLTPEHLQMIEDVLKRPYGLVLISGPTGSGKSTTLYSMLNSVDREGSNVISLEDPIEYQIKGVTQSQVMPEIGYTFASGLRSILRQDPNIIMVGEIRDKETAQLAIQAALTGHLVLSTIHTNNSIGIIPRLVDMGVDPYLIAPTLALAIAQRLLRRVDPSCRHEIPMDDITKELLKKEFADLPIEYVKKLNIPKKTYEIKPSAEVPSMTKGRVAVFEMFSMDKDVQQLVLKNPVEQEIYKVVRAKGMITMREDALIKALDGKVLMQEVYGL